MTDNWGAPPPPSQEEWGAPPPPPDPQQQAYQPPSQEEFLASDSVPSFSFDAPPGTFVDGIVTAAKVVQQIDFDTKQPAFWPAGPNGEAPKPKWTLRVHLQTALHETAEDDGIRSVFYDYKKKESLDAAFKTANLKPVVEEGARVRTTYVSGGPKDTRANMTKYKVYETSYAPPGSPAATALAQQLAATPPAVPQAAPVAPPAQPAPVAEPPF